MDLSLSGLAAPASFTLLASNLGLTDLKPQGVVVKNQSKIWEASQSGNFVGDPARSYIGYELRRGGIVVPRHAFLYDVLGTDENDVVTVLGTMRVSTQWEYSASIMPTAELLAAADAASFRHRQGTIASGLPDYAFYSALRGKRNPY